MDNWGEIIYANEEQQKVGGGEAPPVPGCRGAGTGPAWKRAAGGAGGGGVGPVMGPQGS